MKIEEAAKLLKESKYTVAFTGAGISVESGIPPFRGEGGLWNKYDPNILDLQTYHSAPEKSWPVIKELFFDFFGEARANNAHHGLAKLEQAGLLKSIITQNIDSLHQEAGSKTVFEYHGNCRQLVCFECGNIEQVSGKVLTEEPPKCEKCGGLLKPDFIFFGEGIPEEAYEKSLEAARDCEVMLVIGTTGEIVPASTLPYMAKEMGAKIIEINTNDSAYTNTITDVFLRGKATEVMTKIIDQISL
ncbi:NAD-dependent protein deacetylase of SIR2 family [hydrothermal vent metagenome]|uniref:NAD-dependent protein deacetylase of SIR2 family n=1 Tax=hydrothermal vent metagenome TaxID=652676 RepID=A0A1W1EG42_9ZZZZ